MTPVGILDDAVLFRRWHDQEDISARDELMQRYLPRARSVARAFRSRSEPMDDLEQVAGVGLVKALDRYDPAQGVAFWSYALPTIQGELKRYFRDHCWTVHVPRSVQDRVLEVQHALVRLGAGLGRSPSVAELAHALEIATEEVVEALEAGSAFDPRSLDAPAPGDGEGSYGDALGGDDDALEAAEERALLGPALRALPARERVVLHLRFAEDLTQSEIAQRVGISQMHVSRLIRRALEMVRESVEPARAA